MTMKKTIADSGAAGFFTRTSSGHTLLTLTKRTGQRGPAAMVC